MLEFSMKTRNFFVDFIILEISESQIDENSMGFYASAENPGTVKKQQSRVLHDCQEFNSGISKD